MSAIEDAPLRVLPPGGVQVWITRLDPPESRLNQLAALLAPDERQRAGRFVFDRDRDRYIAAHGFVRALLGQYLGVDGRELRLATGAYGKPFLPEVSWLRFNLSHSNVIGALAVANGHEVGVDVEHIRPDFAAPSVARRFFAPDEVDTLELIPEQRYARAFFACWTRKEAFIKAVGIGLSLELDSFSVSVDPDSPAVLLRTAGGPTETARWRLCGFAPAPEYAGALVVEHGAEQPHFASFADPSSVLSGLDY